MDRCPPGNEYRQLDTIKVQNEVHGSEIYRLQSGSS
jgi:hypothetical protein